LCNVAIGIQRRMAVRFGVEPGRIQLEHVGLNHLTWIRAIRVDGVDRLPELIADHAQEMADEVDTTVELLRALGALPSYYLHYYYATRDVLEHQLAGGTRAEDVMAIERELLELYCDPTLDRKPALLESRGGAFYSDAAAQLIASLHAGTGDIQVVDVRNDGALPGLPDGAVVEIPARIDRDGAHPLSLAPLAPEIRGLVQRAKAYEELAVRAAVSGDRRIALLALLANPLVPDLRAAEGLLAAILETNAHFLPRFAAP
jgi:6-phospho-beta-glucosidase